MKNLPEPNNQRELESLLSTYCDGRLDSAGQARLAEWLESDQEARRFYLHYLDLHLDLSRRSGISKLIQLPASQPVRREIRWRSFAAAAAAIVLLGSLAVAWFNRTAPTTADNQAEAEASAREVIAFVTHADSVQWSYPQLADLGLGLRQGERVDLNSGKLRIDFFDGSAVTIVAPAKFDLYGRSEIGLETGKIAVRADGPTPGFSVRTPGALFVDVGTEFLLTVNDSGSAQMRVIDGEVIAALVSSEGVALEERSAFAGQSLTVDRKRGIIEAPLRGQGAS